MINPPDELLEDLQSALPPEQQPAPGGNQNGYSTVNGQMKGLDEPQRRSEYEEPVERASVASTVSQ